MKNENLKIAIKASIKAGECIMQIYNTDFDIQFKNDKSPLTEADKVSNEIINSFLKQTGIPIISEENKQIEYEIRKSWESCWIIDPLDGTKEFIKKNSEFTVNIALVKTGRPILGIIYRPATKELYYACVESKQAFKTVIDYNDNIEEKVFKEGDIIMRSQSKKNKIRVIGSRSHMNKNTLNYIKRIKKEENEIEIISKGSSLKFCLVAEGKADIYPRFAPTMEWDTAAGQAICEAQGLIVLDNVTNKPIKYNRENMLNNFFVVKECESLV